MEKELVERINPEWKDLSEEYNKKLYSIEKIDLLWGWAKKQNTKSN